MKPRKSKSIGSLDSLLDTLTNVVGILVIVLVVTQLGITEAVKRVSKIEGPLADLTPEDMENAQQASEKAKNQLADLENQTEGLSEKLKADELAEKRQQYSIDELREELKKARAGQLKPEDLRKQIAERKAKAKNLEEQIAKADAELAKLKAQLDRTPQPGAIAATIIRLPNPRMAPKGVKAVQYACRHGRVMPADTEELTKLAMKEIALLQRIQKKQVLDSKDVIAVFNRKKIGTTYFRLRVQILGGYPYLLVEHNEKTGGTTQSLRQGQSLFRDRINRLNKNRQYVRYLVWGDSFDTYLAARTHSDRRGLLAGWEPFHVNQPWRISLRGKLKLSDVKPPVVKKKPPAKKPKTPPRPPLPAEQID